MTLVIFEHWRCNGSSDSSLFFTFVVDIRNVFQQPLTMTETIVNSLYTALKTFTISFLHFNASYLM